MLSDEEATSEGRQGKRSSDGRRCKLAASVTSEEENEVITSVTDDPRPTIKLDGPSIAEIDSLEPEDVKTVYTPQGRNPVSPIPIVDSPGMFDYDRLDEDLPISEAEDGSVYWLGLQNFYVITRYNHSAMYAMAVWELSQSIAASRREKAR